MVCGSWQTDRQAPLMCFVNFVGFRSSKEEEQKWVSFFNYITAAYVAMRLCCEVYHYNEPPIKWHEIIC
jgi:hypothetical protein